MDTKIEKTLSQKIADAIDKFYKGFKAQKILKTTEEVEANTNENNLASAVVVGELINDLSNQPQFIYDATGKIIGYRTKEGADTEFPFNDAGYTISGYAINVSYASTGNITSMLPIKGIKHLKFSYAFQNYYNSGYISLSGPNGNKTIVSVANGAAGANQSGTYDQDLDNEYDFLVAHVESNRNGGYIGMSVWDVVATA